MKRQRLMGLVWAARAITFLLSVMTFSLGRGATFLVTNTNDTGAGSLRQAIQSANSTVNVPDVINFNIAGAGPFTISPVTPLPAVTDPIVIDGYSQSGASSNTIPVGGNAVLRILVLEDLTLDTTNSTVRGLAIRQIHIGAVPSAKGSNIVEGCFVGLDTTGTNSLNSPGPGVFVQTPNNRIGGLNSGARNIISGKGAAGVEVFEIFATNNLIQNNYIGTDRTGTLAIGNTDRAVVINMNASRNTINGNIISGNLDRGITLDGTNNFVRGNLIGISAAGQPMGNARTGVEIGGSVNFVGGSQIGSGNIIAYNGVNGSGIFTTNGVDVKPGTAIFTILGNSIFDNAGLGIDVNANGQVTPGFPVITVASNTTTTTVIRGTFMPNLSFLLELFLNPTVDPSGYGEGKTLLISTNIPTDAGGNFTVNWPAPIAPGLFVTSTANGDTEFSLARMINAAGSTNIWTNSVSGKWETGPNWSLNVPPYLGHSFVLITNAGTKTVTNDATTASGFPSTLTISNLVIGAPAGATNTLWLAHGGTNTPLRIFNALTVNSGGALIMSNAALSLEGPFSGASHIDGALTLNGGSLTATNNQFYVGFGGAGTLTVSNGTFTAYYPIVGARSNAVGNWNIAGGDSIVTTVFDIADDLNATGTVRVTGGTLITPALYVGLFGNGTIITSNGFFICTGQVLIGSQPGSAGTFIAAGGSSNLCSSLVVSEGSSATGTVVVADAAMLGSNLLDNRTGGTVRMEGGQLTAGDMMLNGTSQFIFNRGTLRTGTGEISNNVPFVVGNGTDAAVFGVYGTNSFAKGVRITPNAILTGTGPIVGLVTNLGAIEPASLFSQFAELDLNGTLVLSNSSDLRFDIGGYNISERDFLGEKGSVILGGKLSVSLDQDFWAVMTNGSSFTLMTNTTTLTGAFTNVASGGLLTTTDGYARFNALYAGSTLLRLTNLVIVDSDSDGMPDWWEDLYGLNKNVPDATLDFDGDGASNINEFRAGTKPDSIFSVFRVVAFQRETNNVRITWSTVGGKSYRVQTNAPAANGSLTTNFADLSPLISMPGDDESITNYVHVGAATNVSTRYYRIRLGP